MPTVINLLQLNRDEAKKNKQRNSMYISLGVSEKFLGIPSPEYPRYMKRSGVDMEKHVSYQLSSACSNNAELKQRVCNSRINFAIYFAGIICTLE